MLGRYTHPTEERKIGALILPRMSTKCVTRRADVEATPEEITKLLREFGGRREARTRDLRVANAALSQLS
jgi:hypothetical protein